LTRWVNLEGSKQQMLNGLFRMNRKLMKAYLLKESLDRLWSYRYEGPRYATCTPGLTSSGGNACSRSRSWRNCC
jgi:hypothetical protein